MYRVPETGLCGRWMVPGSQGFCQGAVPASKLLDELGGDLLVVRGLRIGLGCLRCRFRSQRCGVARCRRPRGLLLDSPGNRHRRQPSCLDRIRLRRRGARPGLGRALTKQLDDRLRRGDALEGRQAVLADREKHALGPVDALDEGALFLEDPDLRGRERRPAPNLDALLVVHPGAHDLPAVGEHGLLTALHGGEQLARGSASRPRRRLYPGSSASLGRHDLRASGRAVARPRRSVGDRWSRCR